MRLTIKSLAAAGLVALSAMFAATEAQAQLPDVASVAPGEATDADGTYIVSTINKRITIENGRAYVVDPWTQALIFKIKPGMVTLQNFRQTGPDTFEADDLPMMGKVVFNRQPNGTLQGVVQGAFGEAKYALVPTDYATIGDGSGGGGSSGVIVAQDRVYKLYVSGAECKGTDLLRKAYRGVLRLGMTDASGNRLTSKNRNFAVDCTKKGERKQNYRFYDSGPGALTITVPADGNNVKGMRVLGENKRGKNFSINRAHSSLLTSSINNAGALRVGQKQSDWVEVYGKRAKLSVRFTLERVK